MNIDILKYFFSKCFFLKKKSDYGKEKLGESKFTAENAEFTEKKSSADIRELTNNNLPDRYHFLGIFNSRTQINAD